MPTACVALNDEIAVGALHGFKEVGVRVPENISVTGFSNQDGHGAEKFLHGYGSAVRLWRRDEAGDLRACAGENLSPKLRSKSL